MEYLNTFSSGNTDNDEDSNCDLEKLITNLEQVTLPEIAISQVECLAFVAGYAVFSYLNKSNGCPICRDFLTTEKSIQVNDDIGNQFRLIELLSRGCRGLIGGPPRFGEVLPKLTLLMIRGSIT